MMDLKEALATLDPENDVQWTEGGLPLVDVMKELTGDDSLTRQEITDAAPQFTRTNPVIEITEDDDAENEEEGQGDEEVGEDDELNLDADLAAEKSRTDLLDLEPHDPLEFYKALQGMDIDEANEMAAESSAAAAELMETKRHVDDMIRKHQQNMSNAKERVRVLTPRDQPQRDIQAHIKKQNELRMQKAQGAAAIQAALGGKLKPEDIDPRAPIDRAMARKTARGTKRPERI